MTDQLTALTSSELLDKNESKSNILADWTSQYVSDLWRHPGNHALELSILAAVALGAVSTAGAALAKDLPELASDGVSQAAQKTASATGDRLAGSKITTADVVYHGTAKEFSQLTPRPNTRYDLAGKIIWQGDGAFATPDRRIALIYTSKRIPHFTQGVNLVDRTEASEPVRLSVYGGHSREAAMDALYGKPGDSKGFIHMLNSSTFKRESGLGQMEVVSRVNPTYVKTAQVPDGIQTVNPRIELEQYEHDGKMTISWYPER